MVIHQMATIQRPQKEPISSPLILYHFTNTKVSDDFDKFFLRFAHLKVIWSHLFFNSLHFVILIKVLLKISRFLIMGMKPKLGVHVSMTKDWWVARGNSFFFFFFWILWVWVGEYRRWWLVGVWCYLGYNIMFGFCYVIKFKGNTKLFYLQIHSIHTHNREKME